VRDYYYRTRIYYADTDAGGVVHHANYLFLFERARTEALREAGYSLIDLAREHDVTFAVRYVNIDYRKPLKLEDEIEITTRIVEVRSTSLLYHQHITRVGQSEIVLTLMTIKLAFVGHDFKPRVVPDLLIAEFEK